LNHSASAGDPKPQIVRRNRWPHTLPGSNKLSSFTGDPVCLDKALFNEAAQGWNELYRLPRLGRRELFPDVREGSHLTRHDIKNQIIECGSSHRGAA
jgi:hypothetical protein